MYIAAQGDILLWWHVFASEWNGLSLLWTSSRHNPDVIVFSDLFGSWGCGAFSLPNWFYLQWSHNMQIRISNCCQGAFPCGDCSCNLWQSMVRETCPIQGRQHCCSSGYSGHIQPRTPLNASYSNTGVFCCPLQLLVLCFSCCRDR